MKTNTPHTTVEGDARTHNTREVITGEKVRDSLSFIEKLSGKEIVELENAIDDALDTVHHQLQKAREEALARENQLKQVHIMELDAISCKSIEEFVIWRDQRKQRPNHSELDQDNK